jgi:hypothetical protein
MRTTAFSALLLLLAASCQSDKDKSAVKGGDTAAAVTSGLSCYRRVQAQDTFTLHLRRNGDDLSGELGFKDDSQGPVTGRATGSVYRLLYAVESEGGPSVMELFFRQDKGGLLRGVGRMETRGDTVRYAEPNAVQYPATERWVSFDCTGGAD